jgi:hypothetical protein
MWALEDSQQKLADWTLESNLQRRRMRYGFVVNSGKRESLQNPYPFKRFPDFSS